MSFLICKGHYLKDELYWFIPKLWENCNLLNLYSKNVNDAWNDVLTHNIMYPTVLLLIYILHVCSS